MKQTIKIEVEVPDGHKAVYNKDTQKVEIVSAILPKTWEEFCENTPISNKEVIINAAADIIKVFNRQYISNIPRVSNRDKSVLPNKEVAEAFLALMQLVQLRDCYRQGWKPDWEQPYKKYCIYCEGNSVFPFDSTFNSRVLSFQSKEIRNKFLENFKDLIEQAKELI